MNAIDIGFWIVAGGCLSVIIIVSVADYMAKYFYHCPRWAWKLTHRRPK